MCGIAGIIARRPINPHAVPEMMQRIEHRGPDGEGVWSRDDGKVVLGHRRLAIIDPTPAGAQPMTDPSGQLVLTFNGEIYNYVELARRLRAEGYEFRSSSDTEVLLAAYATWGEAGLAELNGMFAFALYDGRSDELFCARDRFGEKPFLYVETPDYFAFASEYKALFALSDLAVEVDDVRLLRFLHQPKQGLDDERQTVFGGVQQLLPGERLIVDAGTLETETARYWDLRVDPELTALSEDDAVDRFRDLLSESVAIRMRSDVPVGSCLSGGLDSGSIVCLNRRQVGTEADYHVFTGRFPGTAADEWSYAEQVIDATAVTSHVCTPTPGGFLDDLPAFIWSNELPVGSSSQFAQWCVFRLAKQHGVTVLLDGQGADELLGGYEQYFANYIWSLAQMGEDTAEEENAIRRRYPLALPSASQAWSARLPAGVRRWLAHSLNRGSDFLFGVDGDLAGQVGKAKTKEQAKADRDARDRLLSPLSAALHEDAFRAHLPTLLRYGDRNSMAHSREVRLPFCDHRIATLALSLPPRYLMGDAETKRLLRGAMKGVLPEPVRTRWNKQGFLPPQSDWFAGELKAWATETVNGQAFAERGIWNHAWWSQIMERMEKGETQLAWPLWKPLIGEAWYRHFVQRLDVEKRVPALREAA